MMMLVLVPLLLVLLQVQAPPHRPLNFRRFRPRIGSLPLPVVRAYVQRPEQEAREHRHAGVVVEGDARALWQLEDPNGHQLVLVDVEVGDGVGAGAAGLRGWGFEGWLGCVCGGWVGRGVEAARAAVRGKATAACTGGG